MTLVFDSLTLTVAKNGGAQVTRQGFRDTQKSSVKALLNSAFVLTMLHVVNTDLICICTRIFQQPVQEEDAAGSVRQKQTGHVSPTGLRMAGYSTCSWDPMLTILV